MTPKQSTALARVVTLPDDDTDDQIVRATAIAAVVTRTVASAEASTQARAEAAERIDRAVFGLWMAAIGDRIGRRLDEATLAVYRAELGARFDTAGFIAAARALFARPLYAQWPGPDEFVKAAHPDAVAYPVPGVAETLARIDAERAAPPPRPETLEDFSRTWRTLVAPPRAD